MATYTCPMDPEVRQEGPGDCPKCGMSLELAMPPAAPKQEWTCPMHPEIVRDAPGDCPICGMALEPRKVKADDGEASAELRSMRRRLAVSAALSAPLAVLGMLGVGAGWIQLLLATPVVLWGG